MAILEENIYSRDWRDLVVASVDLETSGLNPAAERITEIGIVLFKNGKPKGVYNKLINPAKKIDAKASKISGITNDMVDSLPLLHERIDRIRKILGKADVWCAFNDSFDRSFLETEFKRCKTIYPEKPCIDPLVFSRFMWPGSTNKLDDVARRLRVEPSDEMINDLKIVNKRHRACYDALIAGMCLFQMSNIMPRTLRQTLYVQDFLYRYWLGVSMGGNKRFVRTCPPTMPPEHTEAKEI